MGRTGEEKEECEEVRSSKIETSSTWSHMHAHATQSDAQSDAQFEQTTTRTYNRRGLHMTQRGRFQEGMNVKREGQTEKVI